MRKCCLFLFLIVIISLSNLYAQSVALDKAKIIGEFFVKNSTSLGGENGIERRPDTRRLVAGGNQHAHARFWFHVGLPEAHRAQRAVKTRLQGYVE